MRIPLAKPDITQREINEVTKVLKSGRLALGKYTEKFEKIVADFIGVKHAIAVSSGTAGLHVLVKIFDIKDGDEVITTPFSFIASANCILFERAKPVFVDIDPQTLGIDPAKIKAKITPKTRAIIGVDVFGHPADWTELTKIAHKHKILLIDDACEALGSVWRGKKCGSFGDAGVLAFYPNKQISCGEGGMILTNNIKIDKLARALRNQGRLNYTWLQHDILGYNYRLDEMSAALGYIQMIRSRQILQKRQKIVNIYNTLLNRELADMIDTPYKSPGCSINYFVYVIQLKPRFKQVDRDQIIKQLSAKGIAASNYFPPIHLQPFYRQQFHYKQNDFPVTENISQRTIALPFYSNLTTAELKYIVKSLAAILKPYL